MKIKNLIQDYLGKGQLGKLDVLSQLSQGLITEFGYSHIVANIGERCKTQLYAGHGPSLVASVNSDVKSVIPRDKKNGMVVIEAHKRIKLPGDPFITT